jgi:glycosyltransferase involved in cell wall biosynthesis
MKIGIHKEQGEAALGGAEYSIAILAENLSRRHAVDIVHHQAGLTSEQLTRLFETNLDQVNLRYVAPRPRPRERSVLPWRKFHLARDWFAELSKPYNLFVSFTHGEYPIPFCHAPRGVLMVLFPLSEPPGLERPAHALPGWGANVKSRLGRYYHEWEWRRRLATYDVKTANSQFTRAWTEQLWHVDCQVCYPPVDVDAERGNKSNIIVSVGRFSPLKKQAEMMTAFRHMEHIHALGWQFRCAGGVGKSEVEQSYFEKVSNLGENRPAIFLVNLERPRLKKLYEEAKIFWHAAGYGEDDNLNPGLTEHFGIVTVEAMAAGCVPVVIHKGGQPEIVEHGVNGFLWRTLEELQEYTSQLATDEAVRERMAEAARTRAQAFSKENYLRRFHELTAHLSCPS